MEYQNYNILIQGFDTVQCAYSMEQKRKGGIDFQFLREKKESIRELRNKEPVAVKIGGQDFLLHPYGTASGYPILISSEDFKIEMGKKWGTSIKL